MPKPRAGKAAAGHSNYFAVSPWQDKAEKASEGPEVGAAPLEYSEVELDLVVGGSGSGSGSGSGGGGGGLHPAGSPVEAAPAEDGLADAMLVEPAIPGQAALPPTAETGKPAAAGALPAVQAAAAAVAAAAPPPPEEQGWHAKKRKTAEDEKGQGAEAMAGSSCPLPARGAAGDGSDAAAAEQQQQQQQQQAAHEGQVELEGTAYVALLPNGNITGHLVCSPSAFTRRRSFGLMGQVLVSGRECTRDEDWGVLRITLMHFGAGGGTSGGGGHEVSFLAERTEGDAMRLRAPVPWQGLELEDLPSLDSTCSCTTGSGLTLAFRCEQLLTGPAGEAVLQRLQPSLAGRGALLNVGQMQVVLPGEAAAELLGGVQPGPQRAQQGQQGVPGGNPAQRQATPPLGRQQQRRVTGQGSGGSGRVVRDTADDW